MSATDSLKKAFRESSFVIAVAILFVAALGMETATNAMKLRFRKRPVELAARLDDPEHGFPSQVGHWVQCSKDEPLDHAIQEALGTEQFVFREYVNSEVVGHDVAERIRQSTGQEQRDAVAKIYAEHPDAVLRLSITYYTGLVDTVPHVPERCMVADGFESVDPKDYDETFGTYRDGAPRTVKYRFISFEDQTGRSRVSRNVAYLFHVNGEYKASPVEVRNRLQNLLETYGYFAKIELMSSLKDPVRARETINDMLTVALPEVERCLPDWKKIKAQSAQ